MTFTDLDLKVGTAISSAICRRICICKDRYLLRYNYTNIIRNQEQNIINKINNLLLFLKKGVYFLLQISNMPRLSLDRLRDIIKSPYNTFYVTMHGAIDLWMRPSRASSESPLIISFSMTSHSCIASVTNTIWVERCRRSARAVRAFLPFKLFFFNSSEQSHFVCCRRSLKV